MVKKRTPLEPWQVEDAARLLALWEEFRTKTKVSQAAFGSENEIGNQGAVWQYLNGRIALNRDSAVKFAKGLGVEVKAFSPTLAGEIDQMVQVSSKEAQESIPGLTSREEVCIERFRQLSPAQQDEVLQGMHEMIIGNLATQKIFKKKVRHVSNQRMETEFGFPGKQTAKRT